jgi:hypothetical protein
LNYTLNKSTKPYLFVFPKKKFETLHKIYAHCFAFGKRRTNRDFYGLKQFLKEKSLIFLSKIASIQQFLFQHAFLRSLPLPQAGKNSEYIFYVGFQKKYLTWKNPTCAIKKSIILKPPISIGG